MVTATWGGGDAYERYVGRWSRLVGREFLAWLEVSPGSSWLDVGCGTGALTGLILETAAPAAIEGIDPSDGFLAYARASTPDPRVRFTAGDALRLPVEAASRDAAVSGLVLNFVPDPARAVAEIARVLRPGGIAGIYVWDYGDGMQFMRRFWDTAAELDSAASARDEGRRFDGVCRPEVLAGLCADAGFEDVQTRAVDIVTRFRDFDDFWSPFLGGQGAAPTYVASLGDRQRAQLRDRLRQVLPVAEDGSIALTARAWAVKGRR